MNCRRRCRCTAKADAQDGESWASAFNFIAGGKTIKICCRVSFRQKPKKKRWGLRSSGHYWENRCGAYSGRYPFTNLRIPILNMPYPQALRKKNRKRYKKFKKDFDDNFYWTTVNDFWGEKAIEFYNLYKAVLNRAKNKFEFLKCYFF